MTFYYLIERCHIHFLHLQTESQFKIPKGKLILVLQHHIIPGRNLAFHPVLYYHRKAALAMY